VNGWSPALRPDHVPVTGRYGDPVTSGVIRDAGAPEQAPVVSVGRPPWWLMAAALVLGALVTADVLSRGWLERMDLRLSDVIGGWGLRDSGAFPFVWVVTQLGGRVTILAVLAVLVGYLAWRRHTWLPLLRVLMADGASFPSGHVANAVLMWGVARWQAVEYGLPARVQRTFWLLSVVGPLATGLAMVSLDFHWITDAVVGACVGIVLLGVVHALDEFVLSRWVRARAGRPTA